MYKIITTLTSIILLLAAIIMGDKISKQNDMIRLMDKCISYSDQIMDNNGIWDKDGSDCIGIRVRNNKETTNYKFIVRYSDTEIDSEQTFESTVKEVIELDGKIYLSILEIECNKGLSIDKIELEDVFILEKDNLKRGARVQFKVIEGRPIII